MSASDVEDLLAGLSEVEDGNDVADCSNKTEHKCEFDVLIADLNSTFTSLSALYQQRLPMLDELQLSPRELLELVKLDEKGETISDSLLENILGHDRAVRLFIAFAERQVLELNSAEQASMNELAEKLGSLLDKQTEMLNEFTVSAHKDSPNVSRLVDADTAALLVLKAGGVNELAKTPASNLVNPKTSALARDPQIKAIPEAFKRQALRILAGKLVLAARLDAQKPAKLDVNATRAWKKNVENRIMKLWAPPPSLQQRALPKPVDKKNSRRGGKRIRKQKQKRQSEIRSEVIKFGVDSDPS